MTRLVAFLRVTREVDYLRPLVRHRDISVTVLRRVLANGRRRGDVRQAAESFNEDTKHGAYERAGGRCELGSEERRRSG